MRKSVIILMIILIITLLTGCEDLAALPIPNTNTSEADTSVNTDTTTTISETPETSQEPAQSTEAIAVSSNIESEALVEDEEELVGHWEFIEKVVYEPENYTSDTTTIDYFVFNNAATCDSTVIQTATGRREIETISSKVQWSDPDFYYLPDDIIYLQLSAEMVEFDRPPGGTNYTGVSIWAYTAGINSSPITPSSSNMASSDMKKSAAASVVDGEIKVQSDDIEVSGTLGPASDGAQRAIYIRGKLHKGAHAVVKYIYEYKTSALPEYENEEAQDEDTDPTEAVVETERDGHWELKSKNSILLKDSDMIHQLISADSMEKTDDSAEYISTAIFKTLITNDGPKYYAAECLWSEPKATYLPDESFSLTLKANFKGNGGIPIEDLLNEYDVKSFYDLVNIWAIVDTDESAHTAAFCTEKTTFFSDTETTVSGTLGSGTEGDIKSIEIRYSFPEFGGMDYVYEYVLD